MSRTVASGDKRLHLDTSDGCESLFSVPYWEILNPKTSYTSVPVKQWFIGFQNSSWCLVTEAGAVSRFGFTLVGGIEPVPPLLTTLGHFIRFIPTLGKSAGTFSCAAFAGMGEKPCCCLCSSNEMPSDLFMNYLFGTAPLCSVHFSNPPWSHVAQ